MSAVVALRLPLDTDLGAFVGLLLRLGVPHRVSEESGEQVLWVPDAQLAERVRELYARYPEGSGEAGERRPPLGVAVSPARLLAGTRNWPVTALVLLASLLVALLSGFGDNLDAAISTRAPSATALSTSVWTNALATELDGLAPAVAATAVETTPLLDVPIASGLLSSSNSTLTALPANFAGHGSDVTGNTSDVTVVNYTGQGVLELAAHATANNSYSSTMTITIDGVVAYSGSTGTNQYAAKAPVGLISATCFALGAVPFKASLLIQHRCSGGSNTSYCYYKYRKTA